jgi:hypothetical protein
MDAPRLPLSSVANDAGRVAALVITGAFCLPCISAKTTIPPSRFAVLTEGEQPHVRVTARHMVCQACSRFALSYRLG